MTSLLDNLDCSSDSEDINRLFPKCRSGGSTLSAVGGVGVGATGNKLQSNPDVNLNTLHDDCNDNRVLSLVMSGGTDEHDLAPPNAAPPSNLNGLVDADDEETEEEDDDMQDESPTASGGGSPPSSSSAAIAAEVPNGRIKYLRDSRIEIAGGRELYSQSKSKAGRAKRFNQDDSLVAAAAAVGTVQASLGSGGRGGVWEVRGGGGGRGRRSTHAQPPLEMVTETVFSTEVRSIRRVSDASRFRAGGQQQQQPVVYEAPTTPGAAEVVVFDDIGDCLEQPQHHSRAHQSSRHHEDDSGSSSTGRDTPPAYHRPPADFFKVLGPSGSDADTDPLSPERSRAPRVIGGLPIAEYEGSPRRYGPRQLSDSPSSQQQQTPTGPLISGLPSAQSLLSSPSVFPPRPGFPQRVLSKDEDDDEEEEKQESPKLFPSDSANAAFDYLYEFSETRKVLEEFFKPSSPLPIEVDFAELDYNLHRQAGNSYVGQRLAAKDGPSEEPPPTSSPRTRKSGGTPDLISLRDTEEPVSAISEAISPNRTQSLLTQELEITSNHADEDLAETEIGLQVGHSRNFTLSPETTDCDSNDIESEVSLENEGSMHSSGGGRLYGSMPVLEDGLSSGHASDGEDSVPPPTVPGDANPTIMLMKKQICEIEREIRSRAGNTKLEAKPTANQATIDYRAVEDFLRGHDISFKGSSGAPNDLDVLGGLQDAPPPPAPAPHRSDKSGSEPAPESVEAAIKDIRLTLQRTKALPLRSPPVPDTPGDETTCGGSPIWVPRYEPPSPRPQVPVPASNGRASPPLPRRHQQPQPPPQPPPAAHQLLTQQPTRQINVTSPPIDLESRKSGAGPSSDDAADEELDTDLETDRLLGQQRTDDQGFFDDKEKEGIKKKGRNKEVLIEGVLFRARYLGSTQLVCEGQPTKSTRMMQAEEAVSRIKAPEGENQPSTEVDLFISTEKIMVLNTDLKEIMMDHALRTISYIADIGDLVVLMARRRYVPQDVEEPPKINRTPKMICHVFESDEAQFIAQSIGQAFQVAYMEFLKANGIEDHSFVKEMDYQEVLNSQEIFGDELQMFAKKEMQKEVVVPKAKGEILGVVIVESGWGSMLPTVVIANLAPSGAAARCGQLNIGDQIIAINGVSLVGLPLSTCQNYIKNAKTQTVVKLTVVPCAPVVEVKIKRPDTKYQLGFSVQNGVICSLLRGGIAERGGVRVGHRIIEINNQSVVAVPHEKIVNLLATSVGEILMKTMPTSMFRLLTGQETPLYI
ncbi:amyloid-beta A4 precursor protein-binding family A member 2-like isoform X7 [Neocloeon triangulifer]|uniref:amyloid-beta A4 precursor protein-binding family A member 2-like isoform X7 n=1 Tax=Neocloeon triangulifer TaxID=2078957 RepID=UPI00286F182F|nr:amyloid-beta A4 precursor protein-binding family A member 2-like isoform X7 [Neocloeon triangulifer]